MKPPQLLRFGPFELDVRARELRKRGVRIRIPEQSFQLLLLLLEHPGEVVQRAEIRMRLWPNDTVVDYDQSINSTVRRLRMALDESAESPRYIETVAKRNYRFIGELEGGHAAGAEAKEVAPPHYRLLEPIGAGGMGVVYRAEDCQLGRHVAVKFLPDTSGVMPDSARRLLEQEARSASALNHPHICTIFGLAEISGRPGIVMELLTGETLAARLARGPLPLDEALAVARQITGAVAEAHRAGIVHRDLKPANVMLTRSGAKVMDFGLASKVGTGPTSTGESGQSDEPPGTLRYMSPEQIEGKGFTPRSDIFSLGLVLYEMLTGRHPFARDRAESFRTALLTEKPSPLHRVPPAVGAVVLRCLAKAPEDRWESAQQLSEAWDRIATGPGNPAADRPMQSRRLLAVAAVTLVVIAAAIGLGYGYIKSALAAREPGPLRVVRLTGTGDIRTTDISPDGKYVAYIRKAHGRYSLWLKQPNVEGDIELIDCGNDRCGGLSFSPDGGMVYFTRRSAQRPEGALYRLPVLGGAPDLVFSGISGGPAFAQDGGRVAFVRSTRATHGEDALITRNLSTGEERELVRYPAPGIFHSSVAWTLDGARLVYIRLGKVTSIPSTGGKEQSLADQFWTDLEEIAASPFLKSEVLFVGAQAGPPGRLFRIPLSGDSPQQLTFDANRYTEVRAAQQGDLVAVQEDLTRTVQVVRNGVATPIINAERQSANGQWGIRWTTDGHILFISRPLANERSDLWLMNADGSDRRRLTRSPEGLFYADPVVSPSRDFVVTTVWEQGDKASIWRLDIAKGTSKRLTQGIQDYPPDISPDGRWVVYKSVTGDKPVLMKVPVDGGAATQLTTYPCDQPDISPDGKWIACFGSASPSQPVALLIVPFAGGAPAKSIVLPPTAKLDANAAWTPDGEAVSFVNRVDGVGNVWNQPLNGHRPYPVTHFTTQEIFKMDWSPKGDLVVSQGENKSDAVLILGLRAPQNR